MHQTLLVMSLVTSRLWVVMVIGTSSSDLRGVVSSSMSVNINGTSDHQMIRAQSLGSSEGLFTPALVAISNTAHLPTQSSSILHVANNAVLSSINPTMSSKPREMTSLSAQPGPDQDEVMSFSHHLKKSQQFLSSVTELNSVRYQSSESVTIATPMESAISSTSTESTPSMRHSTPQIKESLTPDPTPSLKSFLSNELHEDSVSSSLFKTDVLYPSFSEFFSTSRMDLSSYHTGESEMVFSVHLKTPSLFMPIVDDQRQTDLKTPSLFTSIVDDQMQTDLKTPSLFTSIVDDQMQTDLKTPSLFTSIVDDQMQTDLKTPSLFTSIVDDQMQTDLKTPSLFTSIVDDQMQTDLKTPSLFTSIVDDQMQIDLTSDIGMTLDNSLLYNQSSTFVKTTDYFSSVPSQPPKLTTQMDDAVAMATSMHSLITPTKEQSLYGTLVSGMMNQIESTDSFLYFSTVQYEEVQSTNQAWHISEVSTVQEPTQFVLFSSHPNASRGNPTVATMMSHSLNHLKTRSLSHLAQDSMVAYITEEFNGSLSHIPSTSFLAQTASNPSFDNSLLSANAISLTHSSLQTFWSSLSSNMLATSSSQTALYQSKLPLSSTSSSFQSGFVDASLINPIITSNPSGVRSSMMTPVQSLISHQLYSTFLPNEPTIMSHITRTQTIMPSVHFGSSRFQTSQSLTPSFISESQFINDASFWTPVLVQSSSSDGWSINNPSDSYVADEGSRPSHSMQFQLVSSTYMLPPSTLLSLHNSYTSSMSYVLQISLTDQLQASSRKLLEHSQSMSNESSGVVMATKTSTVLMTTMSVSTYPTLDQSFSTRPYWLTVDVDVPEDVEITAEDFISTIEINLALAYTEGKTRRDEREASVQNLLDKLNPDNDPLLKRRKKRAMTVSGNTAQVIDISRHPTYPVNVVVVYYIAMESGSIPAVESKAIFDELTLPELTFYLGVVVKTNPTEVIPPDVVMTTPPAPTSNYVWIILLVIGLSGFLFLVCCCCFCIFCRRPVKTSRDGPMDMDTLKMLQHKQKYPYKPYKTPNQTPRGFDVAKETDVNNEAADGTEPGAGSSGMKLHHSSTSSAIRNQLKDTRLDMDTVSSSSDSPVVPPLQLQNVQDASPNKSTEEEEEVFHKAVASMEMSSRPRPSSRSPVGSTQPRLLPLRTRMTQDVDQRSSISSPRSPLTTSREGAELKRLYQAAQNEISKILNPDVTSNPPDLIYISPDKRRTKKGKSSKRKRVEQETNLDSGERGQILPDTHYARRSAKQQMTSSKRHPEALSQARRRVHHLIDEAFSLVGLPKNAVSPITPLATDEEKSTSHDKLFVKDKDTTFGEGSCSAMKDGRTFITEHEDRKQTKKKESGDGGTRVLVVPVTHVPDKTSGVVWNPYHAEDELNQLQQSQQLTSSVADRVDMKYKPDEASHLHMPYPLSVTTPSNEPRMKRLSTNRNTDQEQALNQRTPSDGHKVEAFLEPTTSSRRHLTEVDSHQFDDPYLDPYLKKSSHNDLSGSVNSPEYPNAASEQDPYTIRMPRENKHATSSKPDLKQGDMLSTISMERRVGKPISDGYDEIDVSRAAESTNLVAAIRDELIRLAKKTDQNDGNV